jgi:hypothetical protein
LGFNLQLICTYIHCAILDPGETSLIGRGNTRVIATVDSRTSSEKRMGESGTTVILQWSRERISAVDVAGTGKSAGMVAGQVVTK